MAKLELEAALHTLLLSGQARTQEDLSAALHQVGFEAISQSMLSRLLRKMGAVKTTTLQGTIAYQIPREPLPPSLDTPLSALIIDINTNEVCICIHTHPGAANLIGRIFDYRKSDLPILGTIAGDDTVLLLPKSVQDIPYLLTQLKEMTS